MAGGAVLTAAAPLLSSFSAHTTSPPMLKGNINHSVCRWCYGGISLDELCRAAKQMGITSVELTGPADWATLKEHGLTCAMAMHNEGDLGGIIHGFNEPALHDELVRFYTGFIGQVKAAGYRNAICFSGNRRGLSDEEGLKNCAAGLKRLMPVAQQHGVVLVMELLNSKVDHADYQCDHTAWGVELCKRVGSEHFKLLYDVYHMQIMEGDVIRNIRDFHPYLAHYHTGGVPGRHEIDESQELFYPAIMRAIHETKFTGYVAQEFIPSGSAPLASLQQGVKICDV